MDFELRQVYLDLIYLDQVDINKPLTGEELQLAQRFSSNGEADRGILTIKSKRGSKLYKVVHEQSISVYRAATHAGLETIEAVLGDCYIEDFIQKLDQRHESTKTLVDADTSYVAQCVAFYQNLASQKIPIQSKKLSKSFGSRDSRYEKKRIALDLHKDVQSMLDRGQINKSAARVISYFDSNDDFKSQLQLARAVHNNDWSVRDLERIVFQNGTPPLKRSELVELSYFENNLSEIIGHRVSLVPEKRSRTDGRLIVEFYSAEILASILPILDSIDFATRYKIEHRSSGKSKDRFKENLGKLIFYYKGQEHLEALKWVLEVVSQVSRLDERTR